MKWWQSAGADCVRSGKWNNNPSLEARKYWFKSLAKLAHQDILCSKIPLKLFKHIRTSRDSHLTQWLPSKSSMNWLRLFILWSPGSIWVVFSNERKILRRISIWTSLFYNVSQQLHTRISREFLKIIDGTVGFHQTVPPSFVYNLCFHSFERHLLTNFHALPANIAFYSIVTNLIN